jgi:uracil phosphoribosyltransferase
MNLIEVESGPVVVLEHPLVREAISALRDRETSSMDFRAHTRTISRALAYEATRHLPFHVATVTTPIMEAEGGSVAEPVVALPLLRAGLGMVDGFLEIVPRARIGYVGMRRDEETLLPFEYYRNLPALDGAHLFLLDPMLATGGSVSATLDGLDLDCVASCTLLSVIAAPEGVRAVCEKHPAIRIWTAALDRGLNDRGYIVPGLGDAGDRLWGTL